MNSSPDQPAPPLPEALPPAPQSVVEPVVHPDDADAVARSLVFYRVMAYIVGVLLVVLVCVGMPMKYLWHDDRVVTWTGVPHGWLYMILIIAAFNLGRRVQWSWLRLIGIALAGTVPFLSFVAERFATADVRTKLVAARREHNPSSTGV